MDETIEDKLEEAKVELETAKLNLLGAYLAKIKSVYVGISLEQKDYFLTNLEKMVLTLEQNPLPKRRSRFNLHSLYNPSQGRGIREGIGCSRKELAERIGMSARMLYRYENGEYFPRPSITVGRKYLLWLKEQGYNPYNL